MMNSKKSKWYTVGFVVLIAIIVVILWLVSVPKGGDASLDGFAQCIAQKGITMYGASWCPHCQNEKAMFGASFKYMNYVECTEEVQKCTAAGIEVFPTWILSDGKKIVGEQTLQQLSEVSGCPLPTTN